MVRRQKIRRGPAPGEDVGFLKESAALPWVPVCGAKEDRTSPWSALLNDAMLAQRNGPSNGKAHCVGSTAGRRVKQSIGTTDTTAQAEGNCERGNTARRDLPGNREPLGRALNVSYSSLVRIRSSAIPAIADISGTSRPFARAGRAETANPWRIRSTARECNPHTNPRWSMRCSVLRS